MLVAAGFDPDLVALIVDDAAHPLAQVIAVRSEVRLIDFTGNAAFADWLATNARQARLYALTGAVNPVVIDSTDDLQGMLQNLVRSTALFAGRMCTSPRVVFLSQDGVGTQAGMMDLDSFKGYNDRLGRSPTRLASKPFSYIHSPACSAPGASAWPMSAPSPSALLRKCAQRYCR